MRALACLMVLIVVQTASGAERIAVINGRVHTATSAGTLDGATVLIEGGVIRRVVRDLPLPPGVRVIDATGKHVTPGIFAAWSELGLNEVSQVPRTVDARVTDVELGPAFRVDAAVNPETSLIPVARLEGVTRALIVPRPGNDVFAGFAAAIHLGTAPSLFARDVAQFVALGPSGGSFTGGSRSAAYWRLLRAFRDAARFGQAGGSADPQRFIYPPHDLEALQSVRTRNLPLAVFASRASDIRLAIDAGRELKLPVIVFGGQEAWKVADELADAGVPVILDPYDNIPRSFDELGARMDNAALLAKAGVRIAFLTDNTHRVGRLRQRAGNAVAHGLAWEQALRAITVNPAEIFGLENRVGSLQPGRDADLVIWNGDPLELTTWAEQVMIRGRLIEMESRQTRLRDRYRDLSDQSRPFGYR